MNCMGPDSDLLDLVSQDGIISFLQGSQLPSLESFERKVGPSFCPTSLSISFRTDKKILIFPFPSLLSLSSFSKSFQHKVKMYTIDSLPACPAPENKDKG